MHGSAAAPASTRGAPNTAAELEARRNTGRGEYGCRHYRRRARFITPCCDEEWWCRHCHNEAKQQHEQDLAKRHELDRKKVTQLVCAVCNAVQPVGVACTACGAAFGAYACTVCPFFDDDVSKETFHCDECGICRVGGRDNFFHCATCGSCYAASLQNNHVCVERAMHHNCPVCFEFLFESVEPTTVLRCGHTIHSQCLKELERNTVNICPCCPVCSRSLGDYSGYWRQIDQHVSGARLPEEYAGWMASIVCNDCAATSTVAFSLIALKCAGCGGYNTRRMGIDTGRGVVQPDGAAADAGAAPEAVAGAMLAELLNHRDARDGGGLVAGDEHGHDAAHAAGAEAAFAPDVPAVPALVRRRGEAEQAAQESGDEWQDASAGPDPDAGQQ